MGCPLSPPCQQKLFARSVDYGDFFLELLQYSCYTGGMPRRIRDYLDRLSHRNTHREEPNTFTVSTTVNLRDYAPWNATQWFPDNEDTPARAHDMDISGLTHQMLENAYNNMTVREYEELASRNFNDYTPENMLRLVRLAMPNITRNELIHETPMEVLENGREINGDWEPPRYGLYSHNENVVYSEYTPTWSNRTIHWAWGDKLGGHVEYRRGRIIRVKRYCKI